jgi:hypothetical protein
MNKILNSLQTKLTISFVLLIGRGTREENRNNF